MAKNALYAQSGGVTAVINTTACAVIETARQYPNNIKNVYVGRNGIIGALQEDLIDTSQESNADIAALRYTPASAFGTCRFKLRSVEEDKQQYERLIQVFKAHDIAYFFYNGGGDSQDTTYKISLMGKTMGYPIVCIGIPKTVDNDLPITDNCPGFGSVAKYIAVSIREASLDVASMAKTSTKIFVLEVMGRHAGWIAAAAGLAANNENEAPQIILFPEIPFDQDIFLNAVRKSVEKNGFCSIVVSEGIKDKNGKFLSETGSRDVFGHTQLGGIAPVIANMIEKHLNYKPHWAVADYLQRSARHIASKTDVEQAYAVGKAAVEFAIAGKNAVMPVIARISDDPYHWTIESANLKDVANVEKTMPLHFIREDGFGITAACRRYLHPLILGEDYPPYQGGLPNYVTLKNSAVPKKLI